jgi:hypothetical protein
VDDEARITEIRQTLSDHNLSLRLSPAAAIGTVAAEGKWTATIKPESPLTSPHIEAMEGTAREAAEAAYNKFDLLTSERQSFTSRDLGNVSGGDTSKDRDD